jgi:uncharacterized integral membrane protein
MRALFRGLILLPVFLLLLAFSLANRHSVTISIDPFNDGDAAALTYSIPIYVFFLGSVMLGVLIGGLTTWMRQGRFRKAAREASRKSAVLKSENDKLRKQASDLGATTALPAPRSGA